MDWLRNVSWCQCREIQVKTSINWQMCNRSLTSIHNWSFVWKTSVFIRLPALRKIWLKLATKSANRFLPPISAGRFSDSHKSVGRFTPTVSLEVIHQVPWNASKEVPFQVHCEVHIRSLLKGTPYVPQEVPQQVPLVVPHKSQREAP